MISTRPTNTLIEHRRGGWLIGCGVTLVILLIITIVATVFVVRSYRGWVAGGIQTAADKALVKMQIDDQEHVQIMGHVQTLMTRYEKKEITNKQLGVVFEKLIESPLMAAVMVGGIDKLYLVGSDLSDEEKATARLQLRRYASGLFDETIDPDSIETVLASVSTTTPDEDDIRLQYQFGSGGTAEYALRSADEVSADDLRELVAQARTMADVAMVEPDPAPIDLSNTMGIAIAEALGDDPDDWVPGASALLKEQAAPAPHADQDAPNEEIPNEGQPSQGEPGADEGP